MEINKFIVNQVEQRLPPPSADGTPLLEGGWESAPKGSLFEGAVSAADRGSNISTILKLSDYNLIFDRRQADVDYALKLRDEGIHTEEDLRGAYNSSDRNRVASAVNYLLYILRDNGYNLKGSVKSNWQSGDIVKTGDNFNLINMLKDISEVLPLISLEIPDDLDYLCWRKANAVERILFDMFGNYEMLSDMWLRCGEGYSGYGFEEHKLDDYWE